MAGLPLPVASRGEGCNLAARSEQDRSPLRLLGGSEVGQHIDEVELEAKRRVVEFDRAFGHETLAPELARAAVHLHHAPVLRHHQVMLQARNSQRSGWRACQASNSATVRGQSSRFAASAITAPGELSPPP